MFKKRYFSAKSDFKTGFLCKFAIFLGILFLVISGIFLAVTEFSQTNYPESFLALSIIMFAIGIILYFFHCQFVKLGKIVDEVERGDFEDLPEN
jgi:heme/copper-type cytochrome/quinol oxidase subunit 1